MVWRILVIPAVLMAGFVLSRGLGAWAGLPTAILIVVLADVMLFRLRRLPGRRTRTHDTADDRPPVDRTPSSPP